MDLYLVWWVLGALPTWWMLSRKEIKVMPAECYYVCILLWPVIWVACSLVGLYQAGIKFLAWCKGGNRK
jgi:hypothetical protein